MGFASVPPRWARLESTTIWRLESRQNPHAGKRALGRAAFPGCGLAELSSSATGACLRRALVVASPRLNDAKSPLRVRAEKELALPVRPRAALRVPDSSESRPRPLGPISPPGR